MHIYMKFHGHSELSHLVLQCLGQLATTNGMIFTSEQEQIKYLSNYIHQISTSIKSLSTTLTQQDVLGLSVIYENLLRWFKIGLFAKLSSHELEMLTSNLTTLLCKAIEQSVQSHEEGETLYNESIEKYLNAWTMLLMDNGDDFVKGQFAKQCTEIFNSYVQHHLIKSDTNHTADDEIEEDDEPDHMKFNDHLSNIGIIARQIPEHTLNNLSRLVTMKTSQLQVQLEMALHSTGEVNANITNSLHNLYEDLHWLLLITSHVLCEDSSGETAVIPNNLVQFSISQFNSGIDVQLTITSITNVNTQPSNKLDSIIRLVSSCLNLFQTLEAAYKQGMSALLSPQLAFTSAWCLEKICEAYIVPNRDQYSQMSSTLMVILGSESLPLITILTKIISVLESNISAWTSELDVLLKSLRVLNILTNKITRCEELIKCSNIWNIVQSVHENKPPYNALPAVCKRSLYSSIVLLGSALPKTQQKDYFNKMLDVPITTFCTDVQREEFRKNKDQVAVQNMVIDKLETLIGISQSSRSYNHKMLFDLLEPALTTTITVMDVCHNYQQIVELCLELFSHVVKSLLFSLDNQSSERVYEMSLSLIRTYYKFNNGRRSIEVDAEEEKHRDIVLMLELLVNISSKDLFDFGLSDDGDAPSVSATEVVLYGITTLVPLLDLSLLQFPNLCSQYFKLLTFIGELRPDKVMELPEGLLQPILVSVSYGITTFGTDVSKQALEFITELSSYLISHPERSHQILLQFLELLMKMVLFEPFDLDLFDTLSSCVFYISQLFPVQYNSLLDSVLSQHNGHSYYQQLGNALRGLITPIQPNTDKLRQRKLQFSDNLNIFLLDVKGFLCFR